MADLLEPKDRKTLPREDSPLAKQIVPLPEHPECSAELAEGRPPAHRPLSPRSYPDGERAPGAEAHLQPPPAAHPERGEWAAAGGPCTLVPPCPPSRPSPLPPDTSRHPSDTIARCLSEVSEPSVWAQIQG